MIRIVSVMLLVLSSAGLVFAAGPPPTLTVNVRNPLDATRSAETIELQAADLKRLLAVADLRQVHVRDSKTNRDLLVQAVDTNDDGIFEQLIFQTDLGPLETKTFFLSIGERQIPGREDFKAYGRFVRERRDDFAWENDRIAHRMYGAALETWAQEPLTSSAVDVWSKRVSRLVINDWYMVDDYHHDHGEGADLYSAGNSRGCGGNGLWVDEQLFSSANFRNSRVLANGPIRVMFELDYDLWDAHGVRVSEIKRITLDAGQNLDRFESHYTVADGFNQLTHAIGIRKIAGSAVSVSKENGWMRTWEPVEHDPSQLGCAVIFDPASFVGSTEDKKNYLVEAKVPGNGVAIYYAGFGWSKNEPFRTREDWDRYVMNFAARLRAPVEVSLTAK